MNLRLKHILPTPIELIGGVCLTFVIILLANSKRLLNYYGLHSSDELISSSAGGAVNQALKAIDSFSVTDSVVTFLIWAVVGVLCFGIIEALGNAFQEFRLEEQVSSKSYIHPAMFTKVKFWRGVMLNTISLAFGLAFLAAACLLFALFVMPLGLAYSRVFLFDATVANAVYILLGLVILFSGLVLVNVSVRFLLHRRRILSLN